MNQTKSKSELEKLNFRFNILSTIVYIIGVVILIKLFNMQIINGQEYRENSNTRLSRESTIEAARGNILDRSGNTLVSTDMSFYLEMYKTKVEDEQLNNSILLMTNVLESNGDSYLDTFPISIEPFEYHFESDEALAEWKKKYDIPETASAEEAFYLMRDYYKIKTDDIKDIRRILAIRYSITTIGYSTTKSIKISDSISRESAVQLQERSEELTGVNIVIEPIRKYHVGKMASHIIGYMGRISDKDQESLKESGDEYEYKTTDKIGKTGIEKVFEEYLRGEDGTKQIDMSVDGTITGEYTSKEAIGGADIVLTIDSNLQTIAENMLAANIEKIKNGGFSQVYNAKGGAVVVTNVNTGEILAMASYPDYEPGLFYNGISKEKYNEYNSNILHPLWNRAIQTPYAPGSTFKMITAIAALETGVTNVSEKINDNGPYPAAHHPACWYYNDYKRGHGYLNVSGAIEKSCNYFFYEVSNRMGIDNLEKYARYFGLGQKTGIELYNEKTGTLANRSITESKGVGWTVGDTLVAAIGQGYNDFTPVQMAKYISMVANGGHKIDLSIIKSVMKSDGTQVPNSEIREFTNNKLGIQNESQEELQISQETINAVLGGMKSVTTDEGGTAYSVFSDFDIIVGGKTGSAETVSGDVNAWFVGFAPFDKPEIAVVIIVENGGHGYYTAEVVREIIAEYFGMNVEQIYEDMSAETENEYFR